MKAAEVREALGRGEACFAIKHMAERGILSTFTAVGVENGRAVHASGNKRSCADLMLLTEAEQVIAERSAKADREFELREEADRLADALSSAQPPNDADDPDMICNLQLSLSQLRVIVGWLRDDGHLSEASRG